MFFHLHLPQVLILHQEVQQSSLMPRMIMQPDHGERAFPSSSPGSSETASHISQVVLGSVQAQMSEQNLSPCSSCASRDTHRYPPVPHTCTLPAEVNPGLSAEPSKAVAVDGCSPSPSPLPGVQAQGSSHGCQGTDPQGPEGHTQTILCYLLPPSPSHTPLGLKSHFFSWPSSISSVSRQNKATNYFIFTICI